MEEEEEEREPEKNEHNLREFQGHGRWEEVQDEWRNLSIRKGQNLINNQIRKGQKMLLFLCLFMYFEKNKESFVGRFGRQYGKSSAIYILYSWQNVKLKRCEEVGFCLFNARCFIMCALFQ